VVQLSAFAMGLAAVLLGLAIAHVFARGALIMLVLGGIVSGALFTALLSMVKYAADPYNQLPAIVYWLMGSFAQADLGQLAWAAPVLLAGIGVLCASGRSLDALAMGDDEARSLGVPVTALRLTTITAATLICAITVAMAGMIGWVGLMIPHVARLMVGPAHARLLPVSACLGAIFMLLADGLARNLFEAEIPIGIVTELLGIPAFLLVLRRVKRGWA
jgi:iron complex transport system permease protein